MEDQRIKKYEKMAKITGILIGLVLILGISYAVFKTTTKAEKSNIVSAGKLDVVIENEQEAIALENAYPITEEEGKKQDPYIFDVVNKGTIEAEYDLYVETENTTTLPVNRVRYYLTVEEDGTEKILTPTSRTLSQEEKVEKEGKQLYKIDTKNIAVTKANTYKLYLWIDYDATVEEAMNKTFEARVRIEAEYQQPYIELDYIESTGTQYINTGITQAQSINNYAYEIEYQYTNINANDSSLYGASTATTNGYAQIYKVANSNNNSVWGGYPNSDSKLYRTVGTNKVKDKIIVDMKNDTINRYYDNTNHIATIDYDLNKKTNLSNYLFAFHRNGAEQKAVAKIYELRVWSDDRLIQYLIPVIRKSDGEVCMYDLVSKSYFENKGTGNFIPGTIKNLSKGYTQLDYLKTTGAQVIDLGIKANQDTGIDMKYKVTKYQSNLARGLVPFGARENYLKNQFMIFSPVNSGHQFIYCYGDEVWAKDRPNILNKDIEVSIRGNVWDSTEIGKHTFTYKKFETPKNMSLFKSNASLVENDFNFIIYYTKLYDKSKIIMYLIPMLDDNKEPCMYDVINNRGYYNIGTGTFTYGSILK